MTLDQGSNGFPPNQCRNELTLIWVKFNAKTGMKEDA